MSVINGTRYSLIHVPNLLYYNGTTQIVERLKDSESEYFRALRESLRSYAQAMTYVPNQAFIGRIALDDLPNISRPWYETSFESAERFGPYGEIMPEDEFYGLLKIADAFELVVLEEAFLANILPRIAAHPYIPERLLERLGEGKDRETIRSLVDEKKAEGLFFEDQLVGCVKQAHEVDENLKAHIMLENLTVKASGLLAVLHLLSQESVDGTEIGYIIECSEEACGDMNQRGGGNFAKAIGELAALQHATGSDVRGFCAGPLHAMLHAASLVDAGVFRSVLVVSGGSVAKLGMNARDHIKKGLPALEDAIGAFAILISADNGIDPAIRLDAVGKHDIGAGSGPKQVIEALVQNPLDRMGKKICDIDRFAGELQNPELTEPAGAGNVPESNYKMIAALAVMNGELDRSQIPEFIRERGFVGFAPTQGHIPSGIPVLAYVRDQILAGKLNNTMIIGKGSLFLGRMTNLFDGLSMIIEKNPGKALEGLKVETGFVSRTKVGITLLGSEHGVEEILAGALQAQSRFADLQIVAIGPCKEGNGLISIPASDEKNAQNIMDQMLRDGALDAAVTMHYNFPIGVSTVGKMISPGRAKEMYIACTTGVSSANRVEAMTRNAIYGIATAKADGIEDPTIGILNIEGAVQVKNNLEKMVEAGYHIRFADSIREGGEILMRGNDMINASPDVMVSDSLTGNLMMKIFSAYASGGNYESVGSGYGPGVGENFGRIINIISRTSGAAVIANAIRYAGDMAKGGLIQCFDREMKAAEKAGFGGLFEGFSASDTPVAPEKKIVTEEIVGIDVLDLQDAQMLLWTKGIYAESGMGCVGPVILVAEKDMESAVAILYEAGIKK